MLRRRSARLALPLDVVQIASQLSILATMSMMCTASIMAGSDGCDLAHTVKMLAIGMTMLHSRRAAGSAG